MARVKVWFLILMFIVGCRLQQSDLTTTPTLVTPTRQLIFYNWGTYIAPRLLTDFEQRFGVIILYREFDNDDQLLADLRAGLIYDLIIPTDTILPILRREGLLARLDHDNIPNLANLAPNFSNPLYDPQNRYSVPYQWGTIGIGYNIRQTQRELTHWRDLFDPAFRGRVGILDDHTLSVGAILMMLGHSPNTTNVVEIEAARDFLLNHTDQVVIVGDVAQDYLAQGELDVVMEYNGDIAQVMRDDPDIRFVIPEEGGFIFTDVMAIPANAPNKDLAEKFINFILEAENGAILSNTIRYASPNLASYPFLNPDDLSNPVIYPPPDVQKRLFYQVSMDAQTNVLYRQVWEAFREANQLMLRETE